MSFQLSLVGGGRVNPYLVYFINDESHMRNKMVIKLTVISLTLIPLTSCSMTSATYPYPVDWAPIQDNSLTSSCPNLEGVYHDYGENAETSSGSPCVSEAGECRSLSFNLLYSDTFAFKSVTRPMVNQVHIVQPAPDLLEITTKPSGEQHKLSLSEGDFTCDAEGLRLKVKFTAGLVLFANYIMSESRVYIVASDGTLTMNAEGRNVGHHLIIPMNITSNRWVRWERFTEDK